MTTTSMLLSVGALTALTMTPAQGADLRSAVVTGLTGTLRIQQTAPCSTHIDHRTAIVGGRIELTPAEGVTLAGGGKHFALTRAGISFAPFSVSGSCLGIGETRNYDVVHTQLVRAVAFTTTPSGTPDVFNIRIPRESFLISYATVVNGASETGTKFASEDLTGTINLLTGAVQMRVVLATQVTFRALCVDLLGCAIDETHSGTLTTDLTGSIVYPDTDSDGVPDRADNCRFVANPGQAAVATPTITAPTDVTLASCLDRSFGAATAADLCDGSALTIGNNAPSIFPLGPTTVTWTARDPTSRVASDTQIVTVVDTTDPAFTFVPLDLSMTDCGPATLGSATATDDCAGTPVITNNAPPIFFVGRTTVTWRATDASGNDATATQNVTVVDNALPTVSCTATHPTGNSFRVSASDACTGSLIRRLGEFVLADGETIMINETGRPGVRLVNTVGAAGIRHFHVGRGEGVITATDASGNVATAVCR
jgi:hypothetical protein